MFYSGFYKHMLAFPESHTTDGCREELGRAEAMKKRLSQKLSQRLAVGLACQCAPVLRGLREGAGSSETG